MSCVSANEISNSSDVSDNYGNFTELNQIIKNNENVEISKNYTYLPNETAIEIDKNLTITGHDEIIDCNGQPGALFEVSDNLNFTVKNLTFKNICPVLLNLSINTTSNITFIDCKIIKSIDNSTVNITEEEGETSYTCEVTSEIEKLAKSIAGKSTGVDAAKKLAKWVNDNIEHETDNGFYQTPTETLNRKKGNCCCHCELFLQLCEALDITKDHELRIVHVGYLKYPHRHFFVTFDNICVDTDCIFSNPWGRASFGNRDVKCTTLYPLLPLNKTY
nr:transglutaminase-like domain-containing protein [uncultured Methanobrevibacter sp.]